LLFVLPILCLLQYGIKFLPVFKIEIMSRRNNDNRADANARDMNANRLERNSSTPNDLPDSKEDQEKLQPEETFIDLPDVKDIPGQEFVNAPPAGILGDTTISSADEEGRDVFDRTDDEDLRRTGTSADVSRDERTALEQVDYMPTTDEDNLQNARMDNVDFQNEPLNERSFGEERSGRDLDIPGNTDETRTDALGQGDEENKHYSLGSTDNDNVTGGTP
jgi:hypothetical protein